MKNHSRTAAGFVRRRDFLRGAASVAAALPLVTCKGGSSGGGTGEEEPLVVGGLPVTCNLTLPVACTARVADKEAKRTSGALFEYSKYSGWPEVKESLMSGRIQAA
jgi:NitT/TauT family transport system substrate-binding protein